MATPGGKVLVVDDLSDWRSMIGGLLRDAGYEVQVAEDEESAMRLLRQAPYHVAIVDLRLDERDEQNRSGLSLSERMKEYQPELAVIILTGHADLESLKTAREPRADGGAIAFDFLEKHEITKLLQRIDMAFTTQARVNPQLKIKLDADLTWAQLRSETKCLRSLELDAARQELVDLFQRLFHQAEEIAVKSLFQGHGGGSVNLVAPILQGIPLTTVVVKFDERARALRESRNYDQYVERYIGGARRTQRLDFRCTARLGGIAYSFVGAGPAEFRRFRDVYSNESITVLKQVLDNLFLETCRTWYVNTSKMNGSQQVLGAKYKEWLNLNSRKLEAALLDLVERSDKMGLTFADADRPFQSPIRLNGLNAELANPLPLSYAPFVYNGPFYYTHGDLHEDNILVDSHHQTWLIDFFHTGPAHPARDFALLECAIKFDLQEKQCPPTVLYEWERTHRSLRMGT
jgi:CheY-like chemotaxis protein